MREKISEIISNVFRYLLNCLLALLALLLTVASFKEVISLYQIVFKTGTINYSKIIEEVLIFFIFFEFIALIIKYFQSNYHFPLQYFIYIGVTAITRHIIAHQLTATDTLILSGAILLLLLTLVIINHHDLDETSDNNI